MKTVEVGIDTHDVRKLISSNEEYPDVFMVEVDQNLNILLDQHIDGSPTTLRLVLRGDGRWWATKHVEV